MTVATRTICDWAQAQSLSLEMPFEPGPERADLEYGNADLIGIITKVPGGAGETLQGAFEEFSIMVQMRARTFQYELLEADADALDGLFRAIENATIWGTYIRYVFRQGTITPDFEEDERVSFLANYVIAEGQTSG